MHRSKRSETPRLVVVVIEGSEDQELDEDSIQEWNGALRWRPDGVSDGVSRPTRHGPAASVDLHVSQGMSLRQAP